MHIKVDDEGKITGISGNSCARGEKYAAAEIINPVRTLTSTVRIEGAEEYLLPVKTAAPISKDRLFDAMAVIHRLSVRAPVRLGDVIADFDGTGIIACKTIPEK